MALLGNALLLVAVATAGAKLRVKRVVGGEIYPDGAYPYHVSLWYMGDNNPYTAKTPDLHHTCGGSLIDRQWVLTSALCFDDDFLPGLGNTSLWEVVLGMYDQRGARGKAYFATIEKVFPGPEYNLKRSRGDIALLKLTERVPLGGGVGLVKYNTDPNCPTDGQLSLVLGWGQNQSESYGLGLDFPHKASVYATSVQTCHDDYLPVSEEMGGIVIDDTYLCAGRDKGGADGCYGDSGSPLVTKCFKSQVITGVMSTGYGCAQAGYPGVYTRISYFSDWIARTIKENS